MLTIGEKMAQEKTYFKGDGATVTSSRVIVGDKNFILRNISAVELFHQKLALWGIIIAVFFGVLGVWLLSLGMNLGLIYLAGLIAPFIMKDKYHVQIHSGGTPNNTLSSPSSEIPQKVVDAINEALLNIDSAEASKDTKEKSIESSPEEKIMKFKKLLDADAITQEEFDTKKKELLGL